MAVVKVFGLVDSLVVKVCSPVVTGILGGARGVGSILNTVPKKIVAHAFRQVRSFQDLTPDFVGWKPLDSRFGGIFWPHGGLKYTKCYKRDSLQIRKWKMPQKSVLVISTLERSMQMYADRGDLL